jgi:hypothetical protein
MARTKQTARKSHGGAAPRKTLLAQVGSQNSQSAPLPVALPVGLARASGGSNVLPGKSLDITTRSKSKKTELAVVSKSDEQTHVSFVSLFFSVASSQRVLVVHRLPQWRDALIVPQLQTWSLF